MVFGLVLLSFILQSVIFPPLDLWPLAFVCLVPWFIVIGVLASANAVYLLSYLLGLAFFLVNMWWMSHTTAPGWIAMSCYLAVYYPLVACLIRHAIRRRRVPLAVVGPIAWVGSEFCRAVVISGFPWFFLGHSQYRFLSLIQISDLVGAYGVSFVVAAVNGAIADWLIRRYWLACLPEPGCRRHSTPGWVFAGSLLVLCLAYGWFRLSQDVTTPGPRIAVVQENYPNYVSQDEQVPSAWEKARGYDKLLGEVRAEDPDLYLLPETPWTMSLNEELLSLNPGDPGLTMSPRYVEISRRSYEMLRDHAVSTGAYVLCGAMSIIPTPYSVRSADIKHNSAFLFAPDGSPPRRYDKIHCVYFGEIVPFRFGRLRFMYLWMDSLMPFSSPGYEYSLTEGTDYKIFEIQSRKNPEESYRFGAPICYEDVMPYISRRFVTDPQTGRKRVDFLVNISNDGWFLHSSELPQHLAICAFRAVENRVSIARAVNTGISGFIDSDGKIHDLVNTGGRTLGPDVRGYSVAAIGIDSRHSCYSRAGDWFAISCAVLGLLLYVDYVVVRALAGGLQPARAGETRE